MKLAEFLLSIGYLQIDKAKEKIDFFKNTLNCEFLDVIEMVKTQPKILDLPNEKILSKIELLEEKLGLGHEKVLRIIVKQVNFLGITTKMINEKTEFLKNTFDLNKEKCQSFISAIPEILLYKDNAIENRIQYFQDRLNINKEQAKRLILNFPPILKREMIEQVEYYFDSSMKYINQVAGEGKAINAIIKNANLLTFPAKKMKIRYLILAPILGKKVVLEGKHLIKKERTLWARREFLKNNGYDLSLIIDNKKSFEERAGMSDNQLMKKFPLTLESLEVLEKEYFLKFGEKLLLNSEEKREVFVSDADRKARRYYGSLRKQEESENN